MESKTAPLHVTLTSGAIAAIGSTYTKQPLDRLKWLRQVSEGNSNLTQSTYSNVMRHILRNEGVSGSFRGVTAAVTRNMPHAALIYTLFPMIKNEIKLHSNERSIHINDSLINAMSGSIASIIVTCITHPGDTMRVRFTVQFSSSIRYSSYSQLFASMYAEGIGSFYRGLFVSCIGTTVRGGVGFGFYETLKSEDIKHWHVKHPVFERFAIGFVAGAVSTFASYPADTVRRRMQVWGMNRELTRNEAKNFGNILPEYIKNARSLFAHILRNEGMRGMFKGFGITMVKTPIATAVSLTLNDIAKKYIFDIDA